MTRTLEAAACAAVLCAAAACGATSTIPGGPSALSCAPAVSPTSQAVPPGGGSFHAAVAGSCSWSTTSTDAWIVVTHGQGSDVGTVTYDVLPNAGASRQGRVRIGDVSVTVTQAAAAATPVDPPAPPPAGPPAPPAPPAPPVPPAPPSPPPPPGTPGAPGTPGTGACSYAITATAARAPAGGATLTAMVTTAAGCPWVASSPDPWISLASGQRTGSGSVDAVVAQNTGAARAGRIDAATASLVIEQDAAPLPPCTFRLVPSQNPVPAQGGDVTLDVTTGAHCKWEASSADDWLDVPRTPTAGSGRVSVGVRPNTGDGRTGRIVVGTSFVDIAQEGCVTDVSPEAQRLPAGTSSGKLAVTAPDACVWSVRAPAWIHGLPASGKGSMAFAFRVEANTGRDRTGTIEIGGRKVQVFQDAFALRATAASAGF